MYPVWSVLLAFLELWGIEREASRLHIQCEMSHTVAATAGLSLEFLLGVTLNLFPAIIP